MGNKHTWNHGQFCWADLGTTDQDGAKTFYGELFGWKLDDNPMPAGAPGTYTTALLGDDDVAGIYTLAPEAAEKMPPSWACYVAVDDIDGLTAKVPELGGKVVMEAFDIPEVGRMSVIQDPAGAMLCLWKRDSAHGGYAKLDQKTGSITWMETLTTNVDTAGKFYASLLGWEPKAHGDYVQFFMGDQAIAGMMQIQKEMGPIPSHWALYFAVDDCDACVKKAQGLGAQVLVPPMDVENVGRFATMKDPQGATFSVLKLAPRA